MPEEVLRVLIREELADTVIPLIENGVQPIGLQGPEGRFQTANGKYQSDSIEYLEIKNICFGRPAEYRPPKDKPMVLSQHYKVTKGKGYSE
jgi:hypothetical protein